MKEFTLSRGSALVVVAHPDDETIWMGGTILINRRRVNWTIISLSRAADPDRAPRFRAVCRFYGARGIILNMDDEGHLGIRASVKEVETLINKHAPRRKFDFLFTHGASGEYGHLKHRAVHRAARNLINGERLIAPSVFAFAYRLNERRGIAVPDRADLYRDLPPRIARTKREVIEGKYGFSGASFESRSAGSREAFDILQT